MSTVTPPRPMTIAEFHALPVDDGVDRELIRGELMEKLVTRRNKWHARVEARISALIDHWLESQPTPRGEVFSGEAGVDFPDLDSSVGIDVAYFSAETLAAQSDEATYLVGAPVLAVEILSPSDKHEDVHNKIDAYLDAGVALVWIVDTHRRTVTVYRPDAQPRMFSGDDELTTEPHLPNFTTPVTKLFER